MTKKDTKQTREAIDKARATKRAGFAKVTERVYTFIVNFQRVHGRTPTQTEVSIAFGYVWGNGARTHLRALVQQGRISFGPKVHKVRPIIVMDKDGIV